MSPEKKAQTCLNRFKEEMDRVVRANTVVLQIREAVIAHGLVSYFPSGSVPQLNALADALDNLAESPVIDLLSSLYVDTHRGAALPEEVSPLEEN